MNQKQTISGIYKTFKQSFKIFSNLTSLSSCETFYMIICSALHVIDELMFLKAVQQDKDTQIYSSYMLHHAENVSDSSPFR